MIQHLVSDDQVFSIIGNSGSKIVVVKFGASWCGPCVALAPQLEQLASQYSNNNHVIFASVDIDQCGGSSAEYGVQGIPATKIFTDGKEKTQIVGNNINGIRSAV